MTPITECGPEERMRRALMAIQALTGQFSEGTPDDFAEASPQQLAKFSGDVYMISHAALGTCGNPHTAWLKRIEEVEANGKRWKLYDVEREMTGEAPDSDLSEPPP